MYYNVRDLNKNQIKTNQKNPNYYQPSSNIKIFQSPSQQYQNLVYNNNYINSNFHQINNMKVNKMKTNQKEKIIEGDLNFNDAKQQHHNRLSKHSPNQKPVHGKPRKSPVPVPKDYKPSNLFSYQKLFANKNNNYLINSNNSLKPKSAFPQRNNFVNNNNIINNNRVVRPNVVNVNSNFPSNKTYNTFNIFKKNLDRTHSPLLRTGAHKVDNMNFNQKGVIKTRHISKSPILGKGSIFNRYKMYGFGVSTGTSTAISNNAKIKKKTPIKNNNNNNIKRPSHQPFNNNYINSNVKFIKGQTMISGELIQDSSSGPQYNMNVNKPTNQINQNKPINNNNMNKNKITIIRNNQNKQISNNNINNNINNNMNNNINNNVNNNANNMDYNNLNNIKPIFNNASNFQNDNNNKNTNPLENINKQNNQKILQNNYNMNNLDQKKEEQPKKNNQRSLSQGPVDLLKKNEPQKENIKPTNDQIKKTITKKIKDFLPYTHVGFDGEEPKENNQDNYFIYKNFAGNKDYIYMSVCDGHGIEGHFVSEFIKEILPYDMSENLKTTNILTETEKTHGIIRETFLIANDKLVDNEEINSLFSGSTCVSVIFTPEKLIVPNIGDSRAVMGRKNNITGEYIAINLSRDHKPTEKDEARRILENDGRIQPFLEDGEFVGPERVWIKDEEVPGLAMTRSFGDRVAATVGVMSEPEIKEFLFSEDDKFMIIASDGVWEFISSQECVNMIKDFYDKNDLKGCCEYLYQESSKRWLKEEEVIDDTTMILVFFE